MKPDKPYPKTLIDWHCVACGKPVEDRENYYTCARWREYGQHDSFGAPNHCAHPECYPSIDKDKWCLPFL